MIASPTTPGQLNGILPSTDLSVGPEQRFLFGVIDGQNRFITDASVELAFLKVTGTGSAQLRSRALASYQESPGLKDRGLYVARTKFDEAGEWGVAASVTRPGETAVELRLGFTVKEVSSTPSVGSTVPATRTLTGSSIAEIESFSSARPPDPSLYHISVADALAQKRPFALLFASPGFCTSMTCGPSLDVLEDLKTQFQGSAEFIHVEIYKDGQPPTLVSMVSEWGLPSEPWLFIVGGDGRLVEKLEGNITVQEAAPALARAIAGS